MAWLPFQKATTGNYSITDTFKTYNLFLNYTAYLSWSPCFESETISSCTNNEDTNENLAVIARNNSIIHSLNLEHCHLECSENVEAREDICHSLGHVPSCNETDVWVSLCVCLLSAVRSMFDNIFVFQLFIVVLIILVKIFYKRAHVRLVLYGQIAVV